MNDDPSSRKTTGKLRSLFERFIQLIRSKPASRDEALEILKDAQARNLIDTESLSMIEGVFQIASLCARDVMVPRAQMDAVNIADGPEAVIPFVLDKAHSRYPVYEGNRDHMIGILLAKELLRFYAQADFDMRSMLRAPLFIPEAKHLNVLLRDFRAHRNHMAIVVDEYGGVAGLVTIEDVLEQIVGEIEDEFDLDESAGNIVELSAGDFRVRALTEIAQFNPVFGTDYSDDEVDTIGGFITHRLGRVPRRGETVHIDDLVFEILRSEARQIHLLRVRRSCKIVLRTAASTRTARLRPAATCSVTQRTATPSTSCVCSASGRRWNFSSVRRTR